MGPDFIGVGTQKAATTWMFKWLRNHPRIGFANADDKPKDTVVDGKVVTTWPKEIHFLDGENWELGWEWYLNLFNKEGREEKTLGEITPDYLTVSEEKIKDLRSRLPNLKILLNIRNPIERDWSAIRMIAKRQEVRSEEDFFKISNYDDVLKNGSASDNIKRWMDIWDRKNFFISHMDSIKKSPVEAIKKIVGFLGVGQKYYDRPHLQEKLKVPVHVGDSFEIPLKLKEHLEKRHRDSNLLFREISPDF